MTILFASNNAAHWELQPSKAFGASDFDATHVDYGMTLDDGNSYIPVSDHSAPAGDTVFYVWHMRLAKGGGGEDGYFGTVWDASGGTIAKLELLNFGLQAQAVGDTTVTGAAAAPFAENLNVIVKLRVTVNAGEVTCEVYVNGVSVSVATALNTGGRGVAARFGWTLFDAVFTSAHFSEFVASDTDPNSGKITKLNPASVGADADMTGGVGDLHDDDGGTGLVAVVGDKSSFTMDTYTGGDLISAVTAVSSVLAGPSAGTTFRHYLLIGGVRYFGTSHTVADGVPKLCTDSWDVDPSDSTAWTAVKINAAQLGSTSEA